jgi:hypothetical protein
MTDSTSFLTHGPISPRVHGTLDYPLAAILIAGPLVLNFHSEAAKVLVLVLGGAATLLAIGTAWSRGIFHVIPPVLHGVADIGATVVLIATPFVFGITEHAAPTVFCIAVGVGGLGATLLTRFVSDLMPQVPAANPQPAS